MEKRFSLGQFQAFDDVKFIDKNWSMFLGETGKIGIIDNCFCLIRTNKNPIRLCAFEGDLGKYVKKLTKLEKALK